MERWPCGPWVSLLLDLFLIRPYSYHCPYPGRIELKGFSFYFTKIGVTCEFGDDLSTGLTRLCREVSCLRLNPMKHSREQGGLG